MKTTVTISRAHKISERINQAIRELEVNLVNLFRPRSLSQALISNRDPLIAAADKALSTLVLIETAQSDLASIRTVIGQENARLGINGLMAQREAVSRMIALLTRLDACQDSEDISLSDIPTQVEFSVLPESAQQRWLNNNVKAAPFEVVELKKKALVAKERAISDSISDLNATKVEIEISDAVASLIGF